MIKKSLILIFVMIYLALSVYSISLELKTTQYGPDRLFDGTLTINKTGNYSKNSYFTASTNNNNFNITLKSWLDSSSITYKTLPGYYELEGSPWASKQILNSKGSKLTGFNLPSATKTILDFKISVTGFGDLKVDIGNDKKFDWQFNGGQIAWSDEIFPSGYNINSVADSEVGITGANLFRRCENLNLTFNELFTSSKVRVNAQVKRLVNGADLNASIDLKECNLEETSLNPNSFTRVSCEITIENPKSRIYQFCLYSKSGNSTTTYYKLPKLNDFYFITANIALYNTTLNGNASIDSSNVKTEIQKFLSKCSSTRCILPINFVLESDGQINIDNILLRDKDLVDYTSLYDLKLVSDFITITSPLKLSLNKFTNLKTPDSKGIYNLKFSFENEESNEISYTVTDAPIAIISVSSLITGINQEVKFSGIKSKAINSKIVKFSWGFGDNSNALGEIVSHSYSNTGNYTVTLTVEDQNGVKSSDSIIIKVESLEKSLPNLINLTLSQASNAENFFISSKGTVLETYKLLGYDSLIREAKSNLSFIQTKYNTIIVSDSQDKEAQYQVLLNSINDIRNSVPISLDVTLEQYENIFPDLDDIPDPKALNIDAKDINKFKETIYSYNLENIKINADIRKVYVNFINGNQSFILVKKTITSKETGINIIENFADVKDLDDVEILRPSNYNKDDEFNLVEFGNVNEILYTTSSAGKTIAITQYKESVCGDKICNVDEDKVICPIDCKRKIPWNIYILISVIVIVGIFYINFYKGPGNFRDSGNWISVRLTKKRLFTNQQDLIKLSNYVRNVLRKGYREEQIRLVLIKKGWNKKQIDYAFNQAKDMKKFK